MKTVIHRKSSNTDTKSPSKTRLTIILLTLPFLLIISGKLYSQDAVMKEFGISTGAFTNFPADQNYRKVNISVFYTAPYVRVGQHEFSAGIVYPLKTHSLYFNESNINPRLGAVASYKFYVLDILGRENLFIHYSFQYLRFKGTFATDSTPGYPPYNRTETDTYINNTIGVGYNLFFDTNERFSFFYILDYVITQTGYKINIPGSGNNSWTTKYIWNNLSTHVGFSFRLGSLNKKIKSK